MTELATAWVTIMANTRGMQGDIRRALNQAENTRLAPRVDQSGMARQGRQAGDLFAGGFKQAMGALAAVTVGAGVVDQFKQIMNVGLDYTRNMNTMKVVSSATAAEMAKVAEQARKLGQDATIPATSVNDAAEAMVELAKGGFTAKQSMDAAKGSLQLAAAAGIQAGEAATIQSQVLQTFALGADNATRVSDVLANAANASSAEIGDVAQALQQGGLVANQFGVSMEDAAATIALLANNGVKGSDAGTLMKTALQALTDQGNPAQGAIEKLGLTVYGANGKFVGMHTLLDQLGAASKRMSKEQYDAATATLFGSDAMRLAGVAVKDGAKSWDAARIAIGKTGSAADVANAKAQGLPGAWERVKNAVEGMQLKAYDALQGPLTKLADTGSKSLDWLSNAADRAGASIARTWKQITTNATIQGLGGDSVAAFQGMLSAFQALAPAAGEIAASLAKATGALGVGTWQLFVTALEAGAGVLNIVAPLLQGVAGFMSDHQALVTAAAGAWLLFRTVPALMGRVSGATAGAASAMSRLSGAASGSAMAGTRARLTAIVGDYRNIGAAAQRTGQQVSQWTRVMNSLSNNSQTVRNMSNAFMGASTQAGAFAGALRAGVQPALGSVRSATSGVIGALGGPWGAAFAAAGVAAMLIVSKNQKSAQSFDALQDSIKNVAKTKVALDEALINARGASTDQNVKDAGLERLQAYRDQLEAESKRVGSPLDNLRANGQSLFSFDSMFGYEGNSQAEQIEQEAGAAKSAIKALDDLKMTQQSLADVTYGSQGAFDAMIMKLNASGDAGKRVAADMQKARTEFQQQQGIAQKLVPGMHQLAEAFRVLGDRSATAADKSNALKNALDALNPARTLGDAVAAHDRVLQQVAQSTQEAADKTKGFGAELLNLDGSVNTSKANGLALRDALKEIVDASAEAASKGQPVAEINAKNAEALRQLAAQYGTTVEKLTTAYNTLGGKDIDMLVRLSGAPEATQKLTAVARAFAATPNAKEIVVKATDVAGAEDKIRALGFTVQDMKDGTVKITANTDEAKAKLLDVLNTVKGFPPGAQVRVDAPGGQGVLELLNSLGAKAREGNNKSIEVEAPNAPGVKQLLEALNLTVRSDNGKSVVVSLSGVEAAQAKIRELTAPAVKTVTVVGTGQSISTDAQGNRGSLPDRAHGAIVPMAAGGLRYMSSKPTTAGIYAGRGAGTIFAEQETGGEAYIPLAGAKRGRSTAILAEVARMFGLGLVRQFEDGGVTIEAFKQYAQSFAGKPYVWGDDDCSGVQSKLTNFLTGSSGRFATGNQGAALAARGFQQGDPPAGQAAYWIGWVNGGPGGGHTAGTIVDPDGGNVNVEMGGAGGNGQYGGSAAGAQSFPNRMWLSLQGQGDPTSGSGGSGVTGGSGSAAITQAQANVTSAGAAVTRAQAKVDQDQAALDKLTSDGADQSKIDVASKKLQASQQALTAAEQKQTAANERLTELKTKQADGTDSKSGAGDNGGQSLGQSLWSGLLQGIGLDGSVFSNPLEWPNVKSLLAGINWGGGLLKGMGSKKDGDQTVTGTSGSDVASGFLGQLNLPNVGDYLKPIPKLEQKVQTPAMPGGPLPLQQPGVVVNGNVGYDPREFTQRIDAQRNQTIRRTLGAVRPG